MFVGTEEENSPGWTWTVATRLTYITLVFTWLLLEMDNLPTTRVLLRSRADTEPTLHVFLSISEQLYCKLKLVPFLVHFNARPNCLIVDSLSWSSVFQDTYNNHASVRIVVFSNFP